MSHVFALATSLFCFGLVCAIYATTMKARPDSWLRGETLQGIMVSLLTGFLPLAITATLAGLWKIATSALGLSSFLSAGVELTSAASLVLTFAILRALIVAANRGAAENVVPLSPRPNAPMPSGGSQRKAA
ncbi:hypothetical protein KUH32_17620 [Thalassococcus sp. CAU 1522]|uniref:MotA/TolQ/ExbB proton channel domain-containing protein n=1 Tax=Thalassococcus arenae TaxID=2851652 RepID=A0ABS6NC50_9RHOB|nr:hypothetical protein [Thalassococcus arenae]MBV2361587.1 hypothetical protein [Thalassococcus arenae]